MRMFKISNKHFKIIFFSVTMLFFSVVVFASGGGGEHAEQVSKWHNIDTYKVLNFGILAIFLFFVAKKPVKEFFTSRIAGIKKEIADLEQKKEEAEKQIVKFEAKLKDLDAESKKIIDTYIQQGKEAKQRILANAEEEVSKLEEMATRSINLEFKTAKAELKKEIVEKAIGEAEKFIQSSISSEDQARLVDEYLEKVVA